MDRAEILAYDLRRAAIHEAGHAVLAGHFGVQATAAVWLNPRRYAEGSVPSETLVVGRTQIVREPPTPCAAAAIGLAGAIAEMYAGDREITPTCVVDAIDLSESTFSATDADLAGDWNMRDVSRCIDLVRELWPEIERQADGLVARFNATAVSTADAYA